MINTPLTQVSAMGAAARRLGSWQDEGEGREMCIGDDDDVAHWARMGERLRMLNPARYRILMEALSSAIDAEEREAATLAILSHSGELPHPSSFS